MINYFISFLNSFFYAYAVPAGEDRDLVPYVLLGLAVVLIIVVIILTVIKSKKQ